MLQALIRRILDGRAPELAPDLARLKVALGDMEASARSGGVRSLSSVLTDDQSMMQRMYAANMTMKIEFVARETARIEAESAAGEMSKSERAEGLRALLRLVEELEASLARLGEHPR